MHVVDEATTEDGLRLLSLLLQRLPATELEQEVVAVGPPSPQLAPPPTTPVHRIGHRFGRGMAWGVDIQRVIRDRGPHLVHAWGMAAGALAGMASSPGRLSVTVSDPAEARTSGRWWYGVE